MKVRVILACFLAAIFSYPPTASALTFDLNIPFGSGAVGPALSSPLLTAIFDDVSGRGVELKLSAPGLTGNSYVTEWYFNIFPNTLILRPDQFGQTSDPQLKDFLWNPDSLYAGPINPSAPEGAGFDLLLTFADTGSSTDVFGRQDSATLLFSYPTTITANWFNELNAAGAFYAAAKIMNYNGAGEFWIASAPSTTPTPPTQPVPEPESLLLSGVGLIGLAFFWRRKKFLN